MSRAGGVARSIVSSTDESQHQNALTGEVQNNKYWSKKHGPHQVSFNMTLLQIRNIDTANETFEAKFVIEQQWMMTRQDGQDFYAEKHDDNGYEPEWHPADLEFTNALEVEIKPAPYRVTQLGTMLMWIRAYTVNGTFTQSLDLQNFPWDTQTLSIKMLWSETVKEVKVFPSDSRALLTLSSDISRTLTSWDIVQSTIEFGIKTRKTLSPTFKARLKGKVVKEKNPTARLNIQVSRMSKPFVFQVFVVLGMISLCSLVSLMPDAADDTGTRLSTATTLFLTVIAFQFVVSSLLPKLPYLTITDYYVLFCLAFVSAILGEVGFIAWLSTHWGIDIGVSKDRWLLAANAGLFVGFNVLYFLYVVIIALPQERRKTRPQLQKRSEAKPDYQLTSGDVVATEDSRYIYQGEQYPLGKISGKFNRIWDTRSDVITPGLFKAQMGRKVQYFTLFHITEASDLHSKSVAMRKITGDRHIPAGTMVVQSKQLPRASGRPTQAKLKIRVDDEKESTDPTAFAWREVTITCKDNETMVMDAAPGSAGKLKFPIKFERVQTNLKDDDQAGAPGADGGKSAKGGKGDSNGAALQPTKSKRDATMVAMVEDEEDDAAEKAQEEKERLEAEQQEAQDDLDEAAELEAEKSSKHPQQGGFGGSGGAGRQAWPAAQPGGRQPDVTNFDDVPVGGARKPGVVDFDDMPVGGSANKPPPGVNFDDLPVGGGAHKAPPGVNYDDLPVGGGRKQPAPFGFGGDDGGPAPAQQQTPLRGTGGPPRAGGRGGGRGAGGRAGPVSEQVAVDMEGRRQVPSEAAPPTGLSGVGRGAKFGP